MDVENEVKGEGGEERREWAGKVAECEDGSRTVIREEYSACRRHR